MMLTTAFLAGAVCGAVLVIGVALLAVNSRR